MVDDAALITPPSTTLHRVPNRGRGSASLIVLSNRLPVQRSAGRWTSAAGGLVTAMEPVLRERQGTWIGWTGSGEAPPSSLRINDIELRPVDIPRSDLEGFYHGMSNRTLWPLYHDALRTPEFHRAWWHSYQRVNERFAQAAAAAATPGDLVWVHDYHLQLVPGMLRALRPDLRIGFFLHIPFPPEELFAWLPWRREILEGLLGADVIGFHTHAGVHNFVRLCRRFLGTTGAESRLEHDGRSIRVGAFPISIDVEWFAAQASLPATKRRVAEIRDRVARGRKLLLAIDRLDYTKGIEQRLGAFGELLKRKVVGVGDAVLVQIATPSREAVPDYAETRAQVDGLVGDVNGEFSDAGRHPIHYFRRNLPREELVAWYAAADVMLVTPLRDGMNLVAKEYVACREGSDGVLVLSEFAGAAEELHEAILVNPRDVDGMIEAMRRALSMDPADASRRMKAMRRTIFRHDVHRWAATFLDALDASSAARAAATASPRRMRTSPQ